MSDDRGRPASGSDMARGMSQASFGLSVALGFALWVWLGWFVGRRIDGWAGIEPWGQVVGSIVGWVVGFVTVYYASQRRQDG